MKDSFILYIQNKEIFDALTNEQAGQLIKAIFKYEEDGEEPELDNFIKIAFIPIKQSLDRNRDKYQKVIDRNKKNGAKGGRPVITKEPKKPSGLFGLPNKPSGFSKNPSKPKKADNDNDNDNDNEHDNDNKVYEAKASTTVTAKASKRKYGEYKNVLLKDEELQKLKEEYSNCNELIKYLDEYIEMKGYKAKSHYLCIKKWVVEAVGKSFKTNKKTDEIEDWLNE